MGQQNVDFDEDSLQRSKVKDRVEGGELKIGRVLQGGPLLNERDQGVDRSVKLSTASSLFRRPERNLRDNAEAEILSLENDMSELSGLGDQGKSKLGESDRAMLSLIRKTSLKSQMR